MPHSIRLTGTLGSTLRLHTLPPTTVTRTVFEPGPDLPRNRFLRSPEATRGLDLEPRTELVTLPARTNGRLILLTRHEQTGCGVEVRHRLVLRDVDRPEWQAVRREARPGRRVEVTGYEELIEWVDAEGTERQVRQLLVERLRLI